VTEEFNIHKKYNYHSFKEGCATYPDKILEPGIGISLHTALSTLFSSSDLPKKFLHEEDISVGKRRNVNWYILIVAATELLTGYLIRCSSSSRSCSPSEQLWL